MARGEKAPSPLTRPSGVINWIVPILPFVLAARKHQFCTLSPRMRTFLAPWEVISSLLGVPPFRPLNEPFRSGTEICFLSDSPLRISGERILLDRAPIDAEYSMQFPVSPFSFDRKCGIYIFHLSSLRYSISGALRTRLAFEIGLPCRWNHFSGLFF